MAKRKKQNRPRKQRPAQIQTRRPAVPQKLLAQLEEVDRLTRRKKWTQALEALQALDRAYPRQPVVLTELVNVCFELGDMHLYLYYIEQLAKIPPVEPDTLLGLAGAYMTNRHPALARQTFLRFLAKHPDHERAAATRDTVANLEVALQNFLQEEGLEFENPYEILAWHEEIQLRMAAGQLNEARQLAQQLLRVDPHFTPALNNLSLVESIEGRLPQAVEAAQRVLALDPANYQALGNLVRFYVLQGETELARQTGEKLKQIKETDKADLWVKCAEAFSYLGDDQAVLNTFEAARAAGHLNTNMVNPLLYHLTAAAALRLGDEKRARQYWRAALKIDPRFNLAQDNLADLNNPAGERHAPWPFDLTQWLSQRAIKDMAAQWQAALNRGGGEALTRAMRRYLKQYPEIQPLLPLFLERGGPLARQFAVDVIDHLKTPDLLALLPAFALSQYGPDSLRHQALNLAKEAGLIPAGPVKMWIQGQQREILPIGFEIYDEPVEKHSPEVTRLASAATAALRERDGDKAERLLEEALQLAPDAPDLLNNLAMAYQEQGREADMKALLRQNYQNHPDYFFGRVAMANLLIQQNDLDQAADLLFPLMSEQRLHYSEFVALAAAYIQLYQAKDEPEAARVWLDMWANIDPDDPNLRYLQRQARLHQALKIPGRRKRRGS